ncbi:MAG: tRNA lysidine(34) synthetase TilS [Ilumatobacter sp.]
MCALSGGPDSAALVALAVHGGLEVSAVHVHHGSRASADHDQAAAQSIADQLGVTLRIERADVAEGANFEARARAVRHALTGGHAMFGHTADDQAETALLGLLRGSGATGLAAIRPGHRHPILALRRSETHALCAELGLATIVDPTNSDPRFLRNRVRNELIPLLDDLADRDVTSLIVRTADLLRTDDDLLDQMAGALDVTDARALDAAPLAIARRAVRAWLVRDGYPPDAAAVERVLAVAGGAMTACEVAGVGRVQRSAQQLSITNLAATPGDGEPQDPIAP